MSCPTYKRVMCKWFHGDAESSNYCMNPDHYKVKTGRDVLEYSQKDYPRCPFVYNIDNARGVCRYYEDAEIKTAKIMCGEVCIAFFSNRSHQYPADEAHRLAAKLQGVKVVTSGFDDENQTYMQNIE